MVYNPASSGAHKATDAMDNSKIATRSHESTHLTYLGDSCRQARIAVHGDEHAL